MLMSSFCTSKPPSLCFPALAAELSPLPLKPNIA